MKNPIALAALALIMLTLPAVAKDVVAMPKALQGDWCPVAGSNSNLYRVGKCSGGLRVAADGYTEASQNCKLIDMFVGPKAFRATFSCTDSAPINRGNPPSKIDVWMKKDGRGRLNMWLAEDEDHG